MNKYLSSLILLLVITVKVKADATCPIIPLPEKFTKASGVFQLDKNTPININNAQLEDIAYFLQTELLKRYNLSVLNGNSKPANAKINLLLSSKKKGALKAGAYEINVDQKQVNISGNDLEGVFNGISSFLQLVKNVEKNKVKQFEVDCWQISDKPLYQWRGLMLDEARHFFGKEKVKQILDWMAYYKLNKFHWHLTDQEGWRIEIKKYPKLAQIGGTGNYHNPYADAKYYTQSDIKEIVAYAKERYIEVIPEIDMPGHASAANKAYPEYSGGGSKTHPEFTFNPGKDSLYLYLSNILREVDALFPAQKIHIGGDEVHYGNHMWSSLPEIKNLMKEKQLKDLKEVENYFFKRIADTVVNINNKVLAWDEVANADLAIDKTILFWWRHNRPEQLQTALDKKIPTVLCPRFPMYFDYKQDSNQVHGPDYKKFSLNSIENIYKFSQYNYSVKYPENENLILGIQANLWTERIRTANRLDYMLFPRIAALAESAWTNPDNKNFSSFEKRVEPHFSLYEKDGLYYFNYQNPGKTGEPKY